VPRGDLPYTIDVQAVLDLINSYTNFERQARHGAESD
jgi:hypothetical protein